LFSSNPYVTIEQLPLEEADIKRSALVPRNVRMIGSFSCRATLAPHAAIGTLAGSVRIGYVKDAKGNPVNPPGMQPGLFNAVFSGWSMPIAGRIVGDISAVPGSVAFGSVSAGKPAAQRITLTAGSDKTFADLRFYSTNRFLSVRVLRGPPRLPIRVQSGQPRFPVASGRPAVRVAEVLLDSSAPAGRFSGNISVALPDGQHVDIPVTALVAPAKPAAAKPKGP